MSASGSHLSFSEFKEGLDHITGNKLALIAAVIIAVIIFIIAFFLGRYNQKKKQGFTSKTTPKYVRPRKTEHYRMPRDALNFTHKPIASVMEKVNIGGQNVDDSIGDRQAGPLSTDNTNEDIENSLFVSAY